MNEYEDLFAGPGEMAARLRAHDWSRCAVGGPSRWSSAWCAAARMMLDSATPTVVALGRELVILYNDAYLPIAGHKHPWLLGRPIPEAWSEVWCWIAPELEAVLDTGIASGASDRRIDTQHGDGLVERYFNITFNPLRDAQGKVVGLYSPQIETTARVLAERRVAALRELSLRTYDEESAEAACQRAAEILAHAPDVPAALFYVVDDDGRHARLVASTGAAYAEIADRVRSVSLSDRPGSFSLAEVVLTGVPQQTDQLPNVCPALKDALVAHALPLRVRHENRVAGVLVAAANPRRPLAEVREFQEMVAVQLATALGNASAKRYARERVEALAALDRAKTSFFSDVSHELRTPLTLLLGPINDVLASDNLNDEDRKLLELARRAASRLKKLVRMLLDFSRVEAGRAEAHYEQLDLASYTAELASMFRSAFEAAHVRFVVDTPGLLEPAFVDREMWEQIVLNLLSNALKFTLEGEVRVRLCALDQELQLEVSDTGCGIAPEEVAHVFDRFYRVRSAHARTQEGTGIGLSLVRELARLHGGHAAVQSQLGRGTSIYVRIPRGSAHLPPEKIRQSRRETGGMLAQLFREEALSWVTHPGLRLPETDRPRSARASAPIQAPPAHGRARVLLADDNADMLTYLRRILADRWEVQCVADGASALQVAIAMKPDLILADVMMPALDGFQLLEALRAREDTAAIPVMLISARAGEEAAEHALAAGAVDYVVKPFSAREVVARIQTQLTQLALTEAERTAREVAEQASRARERFLAMLAHELRSPLSAILGWSQLLRGGRLAERHVTQATDVIEQSVQLLQRLVEDLLDASRITAGTLSLDAKVVDTIAPELERVVDSSRPRAQESGVTLVSSIDAKAGPLRADVHRVQQVLSNLLGNALKFTPRGGRISVTCSNRGSALELRVRDTGRGIAPEALPHVFDQYWMGDRREGRGGGLGLGLSIVRSIVSLHGGTITAESEGAGRGATITVRLPLLTERDWNAQTGAPNRA